MDILLYLDNISRIQLSKYGYGFSKNRLDEVFKYSCTFGHLEIVKLLLKHS